MTRVGKCVLAGLVVLFGPLVACGMQEAAPPDQGLVAMLGYVPEEIVGLDPGRITVRFVDYAALSAAEGIAPLRALGDLDLLMGTIPPAALLGRIVMGPEAMPYLWQSAGRMGEVVGFEWLLHVDRSLEFGSPPDPGLLLEGQFSEAQVGVALEERGFSVSDVAEIPVWHRFDDRTISLAAREPADPFGGHIGAAARVTFLGDALANARSWSTIETIIASYQGQTPSLAHEPPHRALARAVTSSDGYLIQAVFIEEDALRGAGGRVETATVGEGTEAVLPPFTLAVLADRHHAGDEQVQLIGLAYDDVLTAQTASAILAQRVQSFRSPENAPEVLAATLGAEVTGSVIEAPEEGLAIAWVEARYTLPTPRIDPETGQFIVGGQLYREWMHAIMRREFSPLW